VRQSIRGYADGLIDRESSTESLARVASELRSVYEVISGSEDLRRALLDPGLPVLSRRNIIGDIFSGKVSGPTLRLLLEAVDVDRAPELLENIAWLSARMDAAADNLHPVSEVVLGHRGAEERIDGYSTVFLQEVGAEPELASIEDELFNFHQIVAGSAELASALESRDLPAGVRRKIVEDLLDGHARPVTTALAGYATQVGRPRDFQNLLVHLVDRVAAERNRRVADVRSAVEMDDAQRRELATALAGIVGRDVDVRVTVDPHVLAGFVATVGDTVVDGSARRRLELLKERLVLPEVPPITGEPTDG
jgi:F-type H+-transporting ATPase subunit delta